MLLSQSIPTCMMLICVAATPVAVWGQSDHGQQTTEPTQIQPFPSHLSQISEQNSYLANSPKYRTDSPNANVKSDLPSNVEQQHPILARPALRPRPGISILERVEASVILPATGDTRYQPPLRPQATRIAGARTLGLNPDTSDLEVKIQAPKILQAGKSESFTIQVVNSLASVSKPVEVRVQVPPQLTITRSSHGGLLDPSTRTISFRLGPVPPEHQQTIQLTGVSNFAGRHALNIALTQDDRVVSRQRIALGVVPMDPKIRNAQLPTTPKR